MNKNNFLHTEVERVLIVLNAILALVYFYALAFLFDKSNLVLFVLLILGEIFHLWQLFGYLYTVWQMEYTAQGDEDFTPPVDVLIPVCGEPVSVVEETIVAARAMDYQDHRVVVLNDGRAAGKTNWREIEELCARLKVTCITRETNHGAKAGNINNGLTHTSNPFVVVFDSDHVPHADFLQKTVKYFVDEKLAWVQTPQFYKNHDFNKVTRGAWEQQALFFGPICKGKNRLNAVTMCGTNMVIRRAALLEVGGMCEENIAEDFITGLLLHSRGWRSLYIPEVLAEGLAPEDFLSYANQQFRWARGAMDVIFKYNVLFRPGLTLAQRLQYLSSVSFFLSGIVVVIDALLPVVFLLTGLVPFTISTMLLASLFLPYIFFTFYILQKSTNFTFTFKSLAFSMAGFNIQLSALWAAFWGKKNSFSVTSKEKIKGNFIRLVIPQVVYVGLVIIGIIVGILREGINASLVTNIAWALLNVTIFMEFIDAALPERGFVNAGSAMSSVVPPEPKLIPVRSYERTSTL